MLETRLYGAKVEQLENLAIDSLQRIVKNQLPNGLIPASVGRHDDPHFDGMVWVKDSARAVQFARDPNFKEAFPELAPTAKQLYLSSTQTLLHLQSQQLHRFQSRPGWPDHNGYSTIDDRHAPAIKFTQHGHIYQDWGHHQPDNWGILLLVTGKGIEAGWPVLEDASSPVPLGLIVQEITSYAANLKTERDIGRSIWEHGKCWSSYSTRRIVLAGLDQADKVWPKLVADANTHNYPLKISQEELKNAANRLREKVTEHFPADYTDSAGHESVADLASLVVLNDIDDLPTEEKTVILQRVPELENRQGFYRYHGDYWKRGLAEAKWTMGKPIMARHFFIQSRRNYLAGKPIDAFRFLDHGLDRITDILTLKEDYNYIPELMEDRDKQGIYLPNNNELAWTLSYIIQASAAGIVALKEAERFYQK